MAHAQDATRPLSVNPLKSSAPLGAAMAFLGLEQSIPLFHGSQGCTAFALVLMVRHYKETIPIQTTAMNEVSTILGGADHLEEALLNLKSRVNPRVIGVCTTALVETRGEDFEGDLALIRRKREAELAGTQIVFASTPDFHGALEEGWSKAVTAMVTQLPIAPAAPAGPQVNILPGVHQTPADIEHLRDLVEAFGLTPIILPDISGSLAGSVPDRWIPTSYGGTSLADVAHMGSSRATLAIGAHMRAPADALQARTGVVSHVLEGITGLSACDRLVALLASLANRPVPARLRRRRSELLDTMLDTHFHLGGLRIGIAAEPDLLALLAGTLGAGGAHVVAAVTTTTGSAALAGLPGASVGDLGDLERLCDEANADLIVTHAHGRQAARRLGVPLVRAGFPVFDRIGMQHRLWAGYEGTRNLLLEVANTVLADHHEPTPEGLAPIIATTEDAHERSQAETH